MPSISQPWLVSKLFDPVFAVFIGSIAAAIRIQREQATKYPQAKSDFRSLWEKAQRMGTGYFTGYRNIDE